MIDWVSSVMTIMLFVSHMSSSSPSCPEECHCYQDMNMFTANCTSLPTSSENIEVLNLIPKQQRQPLELSEGQFTGFKKLKCLNLSNCSVYSVHKKSFFGVKSLIELDLSYNNIHSLDSAVFQHITNLTSVVLRGNHFDFVSDDPFLISNTIENIDIGNCSITHLPPGVFYGIKRLKYIGLDNNQIKSLKYNSLPRSVMYLNLSNNLIVNVPTDLLASLKNLRRLDLSGNPINCTCPLMNVQDHLSGLGVIFDNEVICAFPSQIEGRNWSQVNENKLCIAETLFDENQQQKYKYQINPKHQISNNEKNNYYEGNIQADQPYVDHLKQDPDSEILFQNDDTRAMGVNMNQEDEELEKQDLKDNFSDEVGTKTVFDDVTADSENKMDPGNQHNVKSYNQEIDYPENTTQHFEDIEIDEEIGEQNDGASLEVENNIESKNSDKVQENRKENEGQETETEKSELKQESEPEKTVNSDIKDHDQIVGGTEAENHNKTEVLPEVHASIFDTEEKSEKEQNKKEVEVNESPEIHQEKDEIESTTIVTVSPVHIQDEVKDGHVLTEILTGQNVKEKADETEELIKDITTQDSINKDVERVKEADVIHISEQLAKLNVENVNEVTTQNAETVEVMNNNETESVVVPVDVEIGLNIISENKSSNLKQEDGIELVKLEETEKPSVDEIKSGEEIKVNKEDQNVPESEIVGTTETIEGNIVTEVAVKSENEHFETHSEGTNQNIEGTTNKEQTVNNENEPDLTIITTTDSEITTTLGSKSKDGDGKVQGLEENTVNPIIVVDETELKTTPSSMDVETTTINTTVDHNESHSDIPEETNIHATTETVIQETTTLDIDTTILYPDTTIDIDVNQENVSIIPKTEQSPTEISSDIYLSPELNTSVVLGNIKQGEPGEDDNLIGDKALKETVPMEFEPAHVVLGCLVVLITVLVLVAIYKCATEGNKPNRTPKDVESNHGTEMQDMASLLPKPNNEEPKIISKKYRDEPPTSETVNLIQDEKKDVPTVTKPAQENENSLNNNTTLQNKPSLNRTATPITINPSAPIQRTRVKVGIIPESIPRTPIFVQKSYNNGVTNG